MIRKKLKLTAVLLLIAAMAAAVEFYNSRETKEMLSLCRKLMGI